MSELDWIEIEVRKELAERLKVWADYEGVSVDTLADRILTKVLDRNGTPAECAELTI